MAKITRQTTLHDAIKGRPSSVQIFGRFGMNCSSCSGQRYETVQWGAMVHGVDLSTLLKELNRSLSASSGANKR